MDDAELLRQFEECTLPYAEWNHQAHVRIAYLYVTRFDLRNATDVVRRRIKAYNQSQDTPETKARGYHETITLAFLRLVNAANSHSGPYVDSAAFCESNPELLDKAALLSYYSKDRIMTWEAKSNFVEPDLRPLPTGQIQLLQIHLYRRDQGRK